MKKAQRTEFFREIKKSKNRYFSILFIVALGVAFYAGVCSSEPDMRISADKHFDEMNLMDIWVAGTLGLTDDDVNEIKKINRLTNVEGAYSAEATTLADENVYTLKLLSLCNTINQMTILEGRMPNKASECFVDEKLISETNFKIGDTITLSSGNDVKISDSITSDTFTIVGYGSYSYYLTHLRGSSSIGNGSIDAFLVLPKDNFCLDAYTSIYATVDSADSLLCYDKEYQNKIEPIVKKIENIASSRCELRYSNVKNDANIKLTDAKKEIGKAEKKLANAKIKLSNAKNDLTTGEKKLINVEKKLTKANKKIIAGENQLEKAIIKISTNEKELADGKKQLIKAKKTISKNRAKLNNEWGNYKKGRFAYQSGMQQYIQGLASYNQEQSFYKQALPYKNIVNSLQGYNTSLSRQVQLAAMQKQGKKLTNAEQGELLLLNRLLPLIQKAAAKLPTLTDQILASIVTEIYSSWNLQLQKSNKTLTTTKQTLDKTNIQLRLAKKKLTDAENKLQKGEKKVSLNEKKIIAGEISINKAKKTISGKRITLEKGKKEIKDNKQKLKNSKSKLRKGKRKLSNADSKYNNSKKEADTKLADARKDVTDGEKSLTDLKMPEWYVLDRNSIQSYVEYGMDAERIGAIGKIFPLIFFLVAALVSLTTMTRMVEENRTQIGTIKALGYSKYSISSKYIYYALSATILGGILGVLLGSLLLPLVILRAYGILYHGITKFYTPIHIGLAFLSVAISVLCTVLATLAACYTELLSTPASLMRPTAPKNGKRVFLERIPFIWNHLNFTKKATVRNLLRYKKRFLMTVIGIGACMALLMVGFGLRDSIATLIDNQYNTLFTYDASLTIDTNNIQVDSKTNYFDKQLDTFARNLIAENNEIKDSLYVYQSNIDFRHHSIIKNGELIVPKNLESIDQFIVMKNRTTGSKYKLTDEGVIITEKLSSLLDLGVGDFITLKISNTEYYDAKITAITENYLSHYVYMTPNFYKNLFSKSPEYDKLLLHLKQTDSNFEKKLSTKLLKYDSIDAILLVNELQEKVNDMMKSLDMVIWVLIISAGLLAYVVLYNLNNINITERCRELATIKVLGFYDLEVAEYVYRENIFLTMFGIVAGIVMGVVLHQFVIHTCEIDMFMFGRVIKPLSYLYSIVLTIVFSIVVNTSMYFKLKKIDMVESMKSVE